MIKINQDVRVNGEPTISARSLLTALGGYGATFPNWISYRLKKHGFVKDVDYVVVHEHKSAYGNNYGRKDYQVTLRMARALVMDGWYKDSELVAMQIAAMLPDDQPAPVVSTKVAVFTPPAHLDGVKTMSSVEIVEVINQLRGPGKAELRHDDFMRKVAGHPGINVRNFSGIYSDQLGREQTCYYLPKREAELMVMSESLEVQTKVYDRLTELEEKQVTPALGMPTNYLDALKQLVATVEQGEQQKFQIAQQAVQLEAAAPAVSFVEQYVKAEGRSTFREVVKLLKDKDGKPALERDFRGFMTDRGIQHRVNGTYLPHKQHQAAGRFIVKTDLIDGIARHSVYFTPKGIQWITKLWDEREPVLRKKLTPVPANFCSHYN